MHRAKHGADKSHFTPGSSLGQMQVNHGRHNCWPLSVCIHNAIHTHTQIDTHTHVICLLFVLGKYMQPSTCPHTIGVTLCRVPERWHLRFLKNQINIQLQHWTVSRVLTMFLNQHRGASLSFTGPKILIKLYINIRIVLATFSAQLTTHKNLLNVSYITFCCQSLVTLSKKKIQTASSTSDNKKMAY